MNKSWIGRHRIQSGICKRRDNGRESLFSDSKVVTFRQTNFFLPDFVFGSRFCPVHLCCLTHPYLLGFLEESFFLFQGFTFFGKSWSHALVLEGLMSPPDYWISFSGARAKVMCFYSKTSRSTYDVKRPSFGALS